MKCNKNQLISVLQFDLNLESLLSIFAYLFKFSPSAYPLIWQSCHFSIPP